MAGQDKVDNIDEGNDDLSSSATVNSKYIDVNCDRNSLAKQLSDLKTENVRLMQDLLKSHQLYQTLLKSIINEQSLSLDTLRNYSDASHSVLASNPSNILKRYKNNFEKLIKYA